MLKLQQCDELLLEKIMDSVHIPTRPNPQPAKGAKRGPWRVFADLPRFQTWCSSSERRHLLELWLNVHHFDIPLENAVTRISMCAPWHGYCKKGMWMYTRSKELYDRACENLAAKKKKAASAKRTTDSQKRVKAMKKRAKSDVNKEAAPRSDANKEAGPKSDANKEAAPKSAANKEAAPKRDAKRKTQNSAETDPKRRKRNGRK